jgi:hypothetical protein
VTRPAAILDIDGTLVDTNYHHAIAWYRAFIRAARSCRCGGSTVASGWAATSWSPPSPVTTSRPAGDDVRAAEKALYMALIHEVRPFADARDLTTDWTHSGDVERTMPEPDLVAAAVEKAGGGAAVMSATRPGIARRRSGPGLRRLPS